LEFEKLWIEGMIDEYCVFLVGSRNVLLDLLVGGSYYGWGG
jgi:hypothetical protein